MLIGYSPKLESKSKIILANHLVLLKSIPIQSKSAKGAIAFTKATRF
jgi:hypothetical protein